MNINICVFQFTSASHGAFRLHSHPVKIPTMTTTTFTGFTEIRLVREINIVVAPYGVLLISTFLYTKYTILYIFGKSLWGLIQQK